MATSLRPRTLALFLGDLVCLTLALWLSLFLRALEAPSTVLFLAHAAPFAILAAVWVAVFFIAGLYESRSIILARRALSATLLVAQTINISIAALFFFFVPFFGVAPKTILFIYLAVSLVLILLWRVFFFPRLGLQKPESAVVVGEGKELEELVRALREAPRAPTRVCEVIAPGPQLAESLRDALERHGARVVIADWNNPTVAGAISGLYNYLSRGVRFFDAMSLYEEVFGRIALSHIDDSWVARNVSRYAHTLYDSIKRVTDITVALPAAVLSLVCYPFIALAIKIEDGGPIFIEQERVGQDGMPIRILKFRSMLRNETNLLNGTSNKITAVGRVLRSTRLDELPQLWSVLRGDLSLIGPRPELPSGVALYEREIPYYPVRHLIKPGLSGWAQLYHDNHPHHAAEVEATREKLSYDLYYLKHRSLLLDLVIILKTIKKLVTRSGV